MQTNPPWRVRDAAEAEEAQDRPPKEKRLLPSFEEIRRFHRLLSAEGRPIETKIGAEVIGDFLHEDDKWICYRRNHLTVNCILNLNPDVPGPWYIFSSTSQHHHRIIRLATTVTGFKDHPSDTQEVPVEIIQLSPSRARREIEKPPLLPIVPQSHIEYPLMAQDSRVITFKRLQFATATPHNNKNLGHIQRYVHLVVEIWAEVEDWIGGASPLSPQAPGLVQIARRVSAPIVVRGRSPRSFKRDRKPSKDPSRDNSTERSVDSEPPPPVPPRTTHLNPPHSPLTTSISPQEQIHSRLPPRPREQFILHQPYRPGIVPSYQTASPSYQQYSSSMALDLSAHHHIPSPSPNPPLFFHQTTYPPQAAMLPLQINTTSGQTPILSPPFSYYAWPSTSDRDNDEEMSHQASPR